MAANRTYVKTEVVGTSDKSVSDAIESGAGLPAVACASARDLLACLPAAPKGCLIVEIDLPEIDGLALVELLLARQIELPVILMSARLATPRLERRLPTGVAALMHKPFSIAELMCSIEQALNRFS